MSVTRNNHYVPQWYQEGFFEPSRSSLVYVDMAPDQKVLPDGRVIVQNSAWDDTSTSRAFRQKDLYSTFFGTSVNDEIERRLFGDIDGRGSKAVRAFIGTDVPSWAWPLILIAVTAVLKYFRDLADKRHETELGNGSAESSATSKPRCVISPHRLPMSAARLRSSTAKTVRS